MVSKTTGYVFSFVLAVSILWSSTSLAGRAGEGEEGASRHEILRQKKLELRSEENFVFYRTEAFREDKKWMPSKEWDALEGALKTLYSRKADRDGESGIYDFFLISSLYNLQEAVRIRQCDFQEYAECVRYLAGFDNLLTYKPQLEFLMDSINTFNPVEIALSLKAYRETIGNSDKTFREIWNDVSFLRNAKGLRETHPHLLMEGLLRLNQQMEDYEGAKDRLSLCLRIPPVRNIFYGFSEEVEELEGLYAYMECIDDAEARIHSVLNQLANQSYTLADFMNRLESPEF